MTMQDLSVRKKMNYRIVLLLSIYSVVQDDKYLVKDDMVHPISPGWFPRKLEPVFLRRSDELDCSSNSIGWDI